MDTLETGNQDIHLKYKEYKNMIWTYFMANNNHFPRFSIAGRTSGKEFVTISTINGEEQSIWENFLTI